MKTVALNYKTMQTNPFLHSFWFLLILLLFLLASDRLVLDFGNSLRLGLGLFWFSTCGQLWRCFFTPSQTCYSICHFS